MKHCDATHCSRLLIGRRGAWVLLAAGVLMTCDSQSQFGNGDGATLDGGVGDGASVDGILPVCTGGTDRDGDGYGDSCSAGADCDDENKLVHPGATEVCNGIDDNCNGLTDEGVKNACGTCGTGCTQVGQTPFVTDPTKDPAVKDASGVGTDAKGDLVLDTTKKNFNYMWIANTFDSAGSAGSCAYADKPEYDPKKNPLCRGTVSKIDTDGIKEVARYFSLTCNSKPGVAGCKDVNGFDITRDFVHAPSRTAVDYNFDVWVANRAFKGQASATKIANDITDCIDRNGNNTIDTSADRNGDGKIEIDCDQDGMPDSAATTCKGAFAGKAPEFLGDDDECVLFTANYGTTDDVGRSICLDRGIDLGAGNAWVGTNRRQKNNAYFRIKGTSGKVDGPYEIRSGHNVYGCAIDGEGILWSSTTEGTINYLNTIKPTEIGPVFRPPAELGSSKFYGIATDDKNHVWLGGWESGATWRYKPKRGAFADLDKGTWTAIKEPTALGGSSTRGIAADNRGKIWVAATNGYVWRIDQSIGDGAQDRSSDTNVWKTKGGTVIGVGVDFKGQVWAVSQGASLASRLDVDPKGDPLTPNTMETKFVNVGKDPYTYSDFTGFGLQNFTRPQGRYLYELAPCASKVKATWKAVTWTATTGPSTSVTLRVRSGDSDTTFGAWLGPFATSPAKLNGTGTDALAPNPAERLQLEFTLATTNRGLSPILHDFNVEFSCQGPD